MVQVYINACFKIGKWTSPRKVLEIDTNANPITVPGVSGKHLCAAVEDVRAARPENDLSTVKQE